jgi:hypothetical protein
MFNGTNTDGSPLIGADGADYRKVDLLSPDTESISEGPNTTRSIFDEVTTSASTSPATAPAMAASSACPTHSPDPGT